ncbi:MAG: hypothetical protein V4760_00580 [Bdellovibrionota bacterium]
MKIIALSEAFNLLEDFAKLPGDVRKDPYRTGLLPPDVWKGFVMMQTSFPREFWVAQSDDGRTIARIGASVSPVLSSEGAIGFFETNLADKEGKAAAKTLLSTAEAWLKSKGVTKANGPMNFNTWFPYRFRVGEPEERFTWEPENPPEYVAIWEAAGYSVLENYHSQGHEGLGAFASRLEPSYEKANDAGFVFRPFESARVLEKEVPILYDISMEGFRENFMFEPIPYQAFQALYVPIAGKLDLGLSYVASHPDHGNVGFFFAFQDKDYVVFKTVAVKYVARGKGVSNAMMYLGARKAQDRGLSKLITAMVKSGAQSESYGKKATTLWENKYVLLSKAI